MKKIWRFLLPREVGCRACEHFFAAAARALLEAENMMKGLFCRPPPSPSGKGRRWSERASSPACRLSVKGTALPPWVDGWIESLALASNKSLPTIRRCVGGERRRGREDTEKAICWTYPPRSTALWRPGSTHRAKKTRIPRIPLGLGCRNPKLLELL